MPTLGTEQNPLLVAIVGSGPSGFYAAEALLKSGLTVKVDMLERLPTPFGLVRSGVAPDHQKLKQAIKLYEKIAHSPDFNLIANVTVGVDISVAQLCASHHAVIFACGAESDRKLGIPGEDLKGSYTATEFVGWYNGHPDYRDCVFDLSHAVAVIIGQGNVAADVGRILAKTVDALKHTDIAQHALDALAESKIKEIHIIGRRGPTQAKFTPKELREFGELPDCHSIVLPEDMILNPESEKELAEKNNIASKKIYDLFCAFSKCDIDHAKSRKCFFNFLMSPKELIGHERLEKIILEKNILSGASFQQSASATGETVELETGLLFRSIGYRGVPLTGVPFADNQGLIPNDKGRVLDSNANIVLQMYAAGWIKRGPSGIIGTNRACSVETVECLLHDLTRLDDGNKKAGADAVLSILNDKKHRYINYDEWQKIDAKEIERGKIKGKPREKYTSIRDMLSVID